MLVVARPIAIHQVTGESMLGALRVTFIHGTETRSYTLIMVRKHDLILSSRVGRTPHPMPPARRGREKWVSRPCAPESDFALMRFFGLRRDYACVRA